MNTHPTNGRGQPRICVIGAGPCGLTTIKNVLAAGLHDVVCFEDSDQIGGNWVFREDTDRMSVYEVTHIISSRDLSSFDDFPMPSTYPDFPSQKNLLAYFQSYADAFGLREYIRLNHRVTEARPEAGGGWSVSVSGPEGPRVETFDYLFVCSGHHREPIQPTYPGQFTGISLHSRSYRRADSFRNKKVLVVGAGNSACDIAVDVSRVAGQTSISMRRGSYIIPKLILGIPIDAFYAFSRYCPRFMLPTLLGVLLRLYIGPPELYGLQKPQGTPLESHPTLNSAILEGFRHGRVSPRVGIDHFDGNNVHFADGRVEAFDAIIWATGFKTSFPFLPPSVVDWEWSKTPPLYLKMMHPRIPSIFFIGLFQPIGCIWNLADHQASIAVKQITGQLQRPADIQDRITHEMTSPHWRFDKSQRHAIEVDAHDFRRELLRELKAATV